MRCSHKWIGPLWWILKCKILTNLDRGNIFTVVLCFVVFKTSLLFGSESTHCRYYTVSSHFAINITHIHSEECVSQKKMKISFMWFEMLPYCFIQFHMKFWNSYCRLLRIKKPNNRYIVLENIRCELPCTSMSVVW